MSDADVVVVSDAEVVVVSDATVVVVVSDADVALCVVRVTVGWRRHPTQHDHRH